ncbi:MAG: GNAT family N-acetyltransferase [Planctomycetes bacterium]|nr:GNAT family N-acetyltransferase [Planctomycetota bacterium]
MNFRCDVRPGDEQHVRRMVASSGFFRLDEIPVAVELVEEALRKGAASGYSFVFAEEEGRPLGYACFGLIPCTLSSFDLYWIVVEQECRGRGIGRDLMMRVEEAVRESGGRRVYIETSTRDQYAPTRHFYERCGYAKVAELPDFYADGDGKAVFCRQLD